MIRNSIDALGAALGLVAIFSLSPVAAQDGAPQNAEPHPDTAAAAPAKLPALKPQPGYFMGRCANEAGKPLANCFVEIKGNTTAGVVTYTPLHSDANGVYKTHLPAGNYTVMYASYHPIVGPIAYDLPLATPDGNNDAADIADGVVRNLILKIRGMVAPGSDPKQDASFWGGSIRVVANGPYIATGFPVGATMQLTLVPEGPLADGNTGKTVNLEEKITAAESSYIFFHDIPLGKYTITARLTGADGVALPTPSIGYIPNGAAFGQPQFPPVATGVLFPPSQYSSKNEVPNNRTGTDEMNLYIK